MLIYTYTVLMQRIHIMEVTERMGKEDQHKETVKVNSSSKIIRLSGMLAMP